MRHLLQHGSDTELQQDFETFDAPPEFRAAAGHSDDFQLWPENLEPLQAFLRLDTQWVWPAMGGVPQGMNYAGVLAGLRMMRLNPQKLFDDLQLMERAKIEFYAGAD